MVFIVIKKCSMAFEVSMTFEVSMSFRVSSTKQKTLISQKNITTCSRWLHFYDHFTITATNVTFY